jgi:hypothetical protein
MLKKSSSTPTGGKSTNSLEEQAHSSFCPLLGEEAGTASLNSVDLSLGPRHPSESLWQIVPVEELACLRLDGTESSTRLGSDVTTVIDRWSRRT